MKKQYTIVSEVRDSEGNVLQILNAPFSIEDGKVIGVAYHNDISHIFKGVYGNLTIKIRGFTDF